MADISKLEQQAVQLDQETIDKAVETIQKLAEVIVDVWNKVVEVVNAFWEALMGFMKQVNPKIYHLAYYHKKHRVRKKNKKRLFLLFRRWLNG